MPKESGDKSVAGARGDQLTAGQLYDILRLRVDVFVVEQECPPYSELDGKDLLSGTRHFWSTMDGSTVAYLRVYEDDEGLMRIGRVCTAQAARGGGLASRLMGAAIGEDTEYVLDAQTYVEGFYARFGFVAEGEPFDDDGIPHIRMRLRR